MLPIYADTHLGSIHMSNEKGITGNLFETQEKTQSAPAEAQPAPRVLGEGFAQLEEKDDPYEDLGYRR